MLAAIPGVGVMMATHHDRLALVLDDVTGPADLVAAAQAEEHQLIGRIDWLLRHGRCHRGRLPLGSHGAQFYPGEAGSKLCICARPNPTDRNNPQSSKIKQAVVLLLLIATVCLRR